MARPYTHILIATDFSEDAANAVVAGAAIARRYAARVTLFHAFDSGIFERAVAPMSPADLEETMSKTARERLEHVAEKHLTDLEGVDCVAVQATSAAHAVVEHAEKHGVDLCIVGTHGLSGIKRMLVGSVAERIIRHAPCDVLTLQHGEQPWPPKRILATTDFSDASYVAVARAKELSEQLSAPVTLAYVYDESIPAPAEDGAMFETIEEGMKRTGKALERVAAEQLGKSASAVVVNGMSAPRKLGALAKEQQAGLVVVGTHGRTGLSHMLIGSVAERVVRHAPSAVLVVRSNTPSADA